MIDPSLNYFPDDVRHIHLMGVCGTGVGALAGMLKSMGYHVTGSDEHVYPPMSDFLEKTGIPIKTGYSPDNLAPRPDLVVVGNVIRRENPEALALAEQSIPYVSFPQALSHYFIVGKDSLVVAGTHGKTTTSSLLASLLEEAGLSPGFMIGGLVQAFGRNFNVGKGQYFVVEGDEYDTAFFDKGPKFLHYRPRIAVITSIEFDHADIYADLQAVKKSFCRLVAVMPEDGCIVACFDDPIVREVVARAPCPVVTYGQTEGADWVLSDLAVSPGGTSFAAYHKGALFGRFSCILPGRHNGLNALAVIAALERLGVGPDVIGSGLKGFKGVKRRQEVRGIVNGVTVIDDFAHHPTSVSETLAALSAAYADHRLIAVFEPRTNSSRRKVFQDVYVSSFDGADQVLVKEPDPLPNLPEEERFSAGKLVSDLCRRGVAADYFADTDAILQYLDAHVQAGDVIAILSNGGFDDIHVRLLNILKKKNS